MKANELMIGDWVKLMNPKGEWIDSSQLDANLFGIFLRDGEDGFLQFAPIPLTEEILKANGWKRRGRFFINSAYDSKFSTILNYENNTTIFSIFIKGIDLKYVHELQHALRLCGLNELADNFKLK